MLAAFVAGLGFFAAKFVIALALLIILGMIVWFSR